MGICYSLEIHSKEIIKKSNNASFSWELHQGNIQSIKPGSRGNTVFSVLHPINPAHSQTHLSKFLDEAEFEVGDNEENDRHDGQCHVILPQTPGGVLDSLVVKILLSFTPETTRVGY